MLLRLFLGVLIIISCNQSKPPVNEELYNFNDSTIVSIAELQNAGKVHELVSFLSNENAEVRAQAVLSHSSIQDSIVTDPLAYILIHDTSQLVRQYAAYSLGQIGSASALSSLIEAYENETSENVVNNILEAIGKCKNVRSSEFLGRIDSISPGLIWGIYRTVLSDRFNHIFLEKVIEGLSSSNQETQLAASHILNRIRDHDLTPFRKIIYQYLKETSNIEAKIALAKSLRLVHSEDKTDLYRVLLKDGDYRIVINTLWGMDDFSVSNFIPIVFSFLYHSNDQVFHSAVQIIERNLDQFPIKDIEGIYQVTNSLNRKIQLAGVLLAKAYNGEINEFLITIANDSGNVYIKNAAYKALSKTSSNERLVIDSFENTSDPIMKGFLFELLPESYFNYEFLRKCMDEDNIALICLASYKLQDEQYSTNVLDDIDFYKNIQVSLNLPVESEAWVEINRMLCFFDPSLCKRQLPFSDNLKIDWGCVRKISSNQNILFNTSKGDFVMELNINEAPGAVSSIYKLIEDEYYNGKIFHRVVPNFVAQGGCPRGDGWGSSSFSLKSELGPLRYSTGTVGLASAGKDTESCQFFITHSPTPHLDGKYTIIGKVVEGMSVVHQLTVGDKIVSASPI